METTTINIELKRTAKGCGYWNRNGAYQQEYDELWPKLVPAEGKAKTVNGELLRTSAKLYYDFFNNGNMNACEIIGRNCWEDVDEDDLEYRVDKYYQECIDFIRDTCKQDYELAGLLSRIEDIILEGEYGCNDKDNEHTYDLMVDHVMHYVLTHEDKPAA